jgi:hypothetical protein
MADDKQHRDARDLGSRSPASEEAKEQSFRGHQGGPRSEGGESTSQQPAQASNRRGARHEQPAEVRKSFEAGQAPSEQGDLSSPGPERIKQHQQGFAGSGTGQGGAHSGTSEGAANRGEPHDEHARHGRHDIPGDRERE